MDSVYILWYRFLYGGRNLLSQKQLQIILISTLIGGILQIVCSEYIKNHPEFVDEEKETPNPNLPDTTPTVPLHIPPAGALGIVQNTIRSIIIKILQKIILKIGAKFLAIHGILIGFVAGTTVALTTIPSTAISTYLNDAFIQNLAFLDKTRMSKFSGDQKNLNQCDETVELLYLVLKNQKVPFKDKEELVISVFGSSLDLETPDGRVRFVLCIFSLLVMFFPNYIAEYFLILKILKKLLKEDNIPISVSRAILRLLKKHKYPRLPK